MTEIIFSWDGCVIRCIHGISKSQSCQKCMESLQKYTEPWISPMCKKLTAFMEQEWDNSGHTPIEAGDGKPVWPMAAGGISYCFTHSMSYNPMDGDCPQCEISYCFTHSMPYPMDGDCPQCKATVAGSIPNPDGSADTGPEPTDKQKALWNAVRAMCRS